MPRFGENRDGNGYRNGKGGTAGAEQGQGKQARAGIVAGSGVKKECVGRGCVVVLGSLRGGQCRLGSAPIISIMVVTGDWSRR